MNLEKAYKAPMIGICKCMVTKDDIQMKTLLKHQSSEAFFSVPKEAEKYLAEVEITDDIDDHLKRASQKAQK